MVRRIGEPGNVKGTDYIAKEFARLGLKPGGDNGTWYQELTWGPLGYDRVASRFAAAGQPVEGTTEWIPLTPVANAIGGRADFSNVPTVLAGRWNDTVALDPELFRGKVAVFIGGPMATGGGTGGGRGGGALQRCDSVPDRFGAAAAAIADAARAGRAGGRGGRGGGRGTTAADTMDSRATTAGAIAMLFIGLESTSPTTVRNAFNTRMGLEPTTTPGARVDPPAAVISGPVASRLFGRNANELAVGTVGQPVSGTWSDAWRKGTVPARNVIAMLPGSDPRCAASTCWSARTTITSGTATAAVDHDSLRAVQHGHAPQGANDPACRPTADQQRRIDSLIAHARTHPSAASRFDHERRRRRRLRHASCCWRSPSASRRRSRRARSSSSRTRARKAGLLGSRWFVDHPTVPLDSIVAAHNMDMVGKGRVDQVKFGGPTSVQTLGARRLSREFGDIIDSVNAVRVRADGDRPVLGRDREPDEPVLPQRPGELRQQGHPGHVLLARLRAWTITSRPTSRSTSTTSTRRDLGRFVHDIMLAIADRKDKPAIAGNDPAFPNC